MTALAAFTAEQKAMVQAHLALTVSEMMGRKLEEGDWATIYCAVKGIPDPGWSNLNIDVMFNNTGVEHKMLCYRSNQSIDTAAGTTLMHPSATRSIRIETTDAEPNDVMRDVLGQYGELIASRARMVQEHSGSAEPPDMRTGWLLWQDSLRQFLYFEERMEAPDPDRFRAEWRSSGGGGRKPSKNLWIYEIDSGRKRYSVTTAAGIKIQPYFDVPPLGDPNLYVWTVIGEHIEGMVRVWVTKRTLEALRDILGDLAPEKIAGAIRAAVERKQADPVGVEQDRVAGITELLVPVEAYDELQGAFEGINDEHLFQMLVEMLSQ